MRIFGKMLIAISKGITVTAIVMIVALYAFHEGQKSVMIDESPRIIIEPENGNSIIMENEKEGVNMKGLPKAVDI